MRCWAFYRKRPNGCASGTRNSDERLFSAVADIIHQTVECRVLGLARHFNVSHVTVLRIVNRLQDEGLVTTEPYRPITLTPQGMKLAKKVKERHETVYQFLLSLGVDRRTAEIDSEGIEHHVSPKTLVAMRRYLKKEQ